MTTPTDTEEEDTLSRSNFVPSEHIPSSSSPYLRIGTSSLHIVNPSSQMEDCGGGGTTGGYDFIREDSDSENSDGMKPSSHTVFPNKPKKRKANFKSTSIHITNTSAENPIVCQLCANQPVFKTESNLKYHNRHFHTDVPEEFPCKVCGRKFPYRGGLKYHMKSVHMGRRFQCNTNGCNNYYTTKSKLNKHQKRERHGSGYKVISLGETSSNYI